MVMSIAGTTELYPRLIIISVVIFCVRIVAAVRCNFENNNLCNFTQTLDDDFDWTLKNGSTRSHDTGPSTDHTLDTMDGHYVYIEASNPRSRGDRALLTSPAITNPPGYVYNCTVRFWYHMYGSHIGTMNVYSKPAHRFGSVEVQWSMSGNQGEECHLGTFSFTWIEYDFEIIFEGIRGPDIKGDIALDDVEIQECVQSGIACTFDESDLCGFTQVLDDDFDWVLKNGSTRSESTGPTSDHTHGTSDGYYIYLEASPQERYDTAILVSPIVTTETGQLHNCTVQFWYHMYGISIGTLNVYSRSIDENGMGTLMWTKSKNQRDHWHFGEVTFVWSGSSFEIVFEGIRGPDIKGDIALDDIQIPKCEIIPPDEESPTILDCPPDITATTELGTSEKAVNWTEPTALDQSPIVEISQSHHSSETFPIGMTDVAYIFRDAEGNTATCTFTIEVATVDTTPPSITNCLSDIQLETELGTGTVTVNWSEPAASDLSGTPRMLRTHAPSTEFLIGIGETLVTYTFTDSSDNAANCTFVVIVKAVDTRPPIVRNCPSDFDIVSGRHASWIEPGASDASNDITVTQSHSPGFIVISTTQVEYVFTDASHNLAYCTFSIIVVDDTIPPVIMECPDDIHTSIQLGNPQTIVTWIEPYATDNHGRVSLIYNNRRSGSNFRMGATNVVYTFADDSHNVASCNFTVTIDQVNTLPPTILYCPGNILVNSKSNSIGETVKDNSNIVTFFMQSHASGDIFRQGSTTVTYIHKDEADNLATCSFDVTITAVDSLFADSEVKYFGVSLAALILLAIIVMACIVATVCILRKRRNFRSSNNVEMDQISTVSMSTIASKSKLADIK